MPKEAYTKWPKSPSKCFIVQSWWTEICSLFLMSYFFVFYAYICFRFCLVYITASLVWNGKLNSSFGTVLVFVCMCVCFVLKLLCIVILKKMRPLAETFNLSVLCDLRLYKTSDSLNFIDFSCRNRMTAEPSHCYPFRIFYCLWMSSSCTNALLSRLQ